ncbi:MAG TPA: flagellar motor protein MotB [Anaeromyxobacteraceae bacterium]|nr:flagellar motor protein MotB [Anaeromyxobacteraceae bacterium]
MARKRRHEEHEAEHENHERWLVSYADFLTLLFAFFVVMYSVSRVDQKRVVEAERSMRWAMHFEGEGGVSRMAMFDGPPSDGGSVMNMTGGALVLDQQQLVEHLRRRIESRVRPFLMERPTGRPTVTVVVDGKRVSVRLAAAEFFDPGQAMLRPQVLPILDAIASEIVPLGRPLQVEGHTDDSPVAGNRFRDNWELSASRAATVTSYLEQAHRADPRLLRATGYAATRPISSADDPEARELNRRIELVVELDFEEPSRARGP